MNLQQFIYTTSFHALSFRCFLLNTTVPFARSRHTLDQHTWCQIWDLLCDKSRYTDIDMPSEERENLRLREQNE